MRSTPSSRTPAGPVPRRRAVWSAAVLVAALLLAGVAHAAPGQYITSAEATPVDFDGDGLFDALNVSVTVQPPVAGGYNLRVTVAWPTPATPTPIAAKSDIFSLDTTPRKLTLSVEGPRIREKGLDGPWELQVTLLSSPSGPVDDNATFETPAFLASDFAEGPDTGKPRVVWGEDSVTLSSGEITASVNLTAPTVVWQTGAGAPLPGRFAVAFPSVVSFADDGDGALAGSEVPLCGAALGAAPWTVDSLDIGPSPDWGSYVQFRLSGPVLFTGTPCAGGPSGNASLTFLIGQHNGTVGGPSPFTLLGGLEVKVDVALTLDGPVPGDALALQVRLEDLDANTSFRMRGPSGYETVDGRNTTVGQEAFAPPVPESPELIAFTDALGAVRGHFSWVPVVAERLGQGQERFVEVTPSRGAAGPALTLYLAVPNDPDIVSLSFDPAVGVPEPVALPHVAPGPGPDQPHETPSFTIFVAALVAVSAIFLLSVYARAKKY